ncbi:hypothetical protein TRM7557_02064 [Tritonibacter multivorans]|uniref:Hedgehog/Intein (Hint) domain-containing protein n=1 Tax=Tritonibacter multivorans TaxID=928856 RepID=A0A0N7LZW9_9RHOB|nr:Hint domain-containing protein [Tritonibacter multivorans]MDA7421410.1 Hint domain-containing protein [Tritonibacter multivorans]CUH78833.1 hypothetical protein TRM7557_02064 [Tritonibacter multivorans]SFD28881.1 Hint domain-containing protein [Tritonibacter multivorans]
MARISELHYSNAYANSSGVSEFLEVALRPRDDAADFVVSFYNQDGSVGLEVPLTHPDVIVTPDLDNDEMVYVISADHFNMFLTDPDGSGSNNYEAFALTNTETGEVIDFYDIGGGTQEITALDGAAAGETSVNLPVLTGPQSTTTTLQFNQPNPDDLVHAAVNAGDSGLACFVAGTLMDTPDGPRRVEDLRPGDLVLTEDAGAQPIIWAGQRTVAGQGKFAPITISKGTLGAERDLQVSPQHRLLIAGWMAELYFGEDEVLAPAKALVNGDTIYRAPCDAVTYVHVMFEQHQLVTTAGLISESFLPGPQGLNGWPCEMSEELFALFPELRYSPDACGMAARRICRASEAAVLDIY